MSRTSKDRQGERRPVGRPPKLRETELEVLRELALTQPTMTIDELQRGLQERTGITVSVMTMYKALRQAGVARGLPRKSASTAPEAAGDGAQKSRRYGYSEVHRDTGDRQRYPSCLTDHEWKLVADIFEQDGGRGRPAKYSRRRMLDACCYVLRSGCSWRMLPKEFPPWEDVYKTFRRWAARGKFELMHDRMRDEWRRREDRDPSPTAGIIDSQSVKTSPQGGPKGFDAGKKVKGRKRHLMVDTLGLLLAVVITTGNVQDRDAAPFVAEQALRKYPTLKKAYVDSAYAGRCADYLRATYALDVEVVRRPNPAIGRWQDAQLPLFAVAKGFIALPKRWVVERTNAWNDRPRRMAKDHDRNLDVSAAWLWLTEARLLARRVAHGTGRASA